VVPDDGGAVVEVTDREVVPAVVRAIAGMPGDLLGVAEEPPTLEEAYLRLVSDEQPETGAGDR
jgi:ABC-2 type transport system ATP-binding protein